MLSSEMLQSRAKYRSCAIGHGGAFKIVKLSY